MLALGKPKGGADRPRESARVSRTEHIVLVWLSVAAVICVIVAAVTKPMGQSWRDWTSGLALGLAAAVIAALLTFLLIDLMLTRQREAETTKSHEQERLDNLLARLRAGEADEKGAIVEELRTLGWLTNGALQGVDLSDATLDGLDFSSADLQRAIFTRASLRGSSFQGAMISSARFTRADIRGARFDDATVDGADFTLAKKDAYTVMPRPAGTGAGDAKGSV